jgi:hypothetical protein
MELEDAVNEKFNLSSENAAKNAEIDMLGTDKDWDDDEKDNEGILTLRETMFCVLLFTMHHSACRRRKEQEKEVPSDACATL